MSTVTAKPRRPGQNTGLRAKTMLHVEDALCAERGYEGAVHLLRNNAAGVTRCHFCGKTWAELDGLLNQRAGWLE